MKLFSVDKRVVHSSKRVCCRPAHNISSNHARFIALFVLVLALPLFGCTGGAQGRLKKEIQQIITGTDGTVGVAIRNLETGDLLSLNNATRYPMQSVYKFALALAVLHRVDTGQFNLDQAIHVSQLDLLPDTWSPLREKYPGGEVDIPLREIISCTVSQSDNNGCDILFRLFGGPAAVDEYIHQLGINGISIKATEEQMHSEWSVQFTNWCNPSEMVKLLDKFDRGGILKDSTQKFLWEQMVATTTGPKRLKGGLPAQTIIAHKTGSSARNGEGISAAMNDAGIIVLPDGDHVAVAVFITNSKLDDAINERVIAEIAGAVYNFYR